VRPGERAAAQDAGGEHQRAEGAGEGGAAVGRGQLEAEQLPGDGGEGLLGRTVCGTQLIEEAKNKDELVGNTNKKLDQLNREIEELKDKTNRLEKDFLRNDQELKSTTDALELAIAKNRDQTKRLKQLEGNLRAVENDLDRGVLERDGLENDHAALSAEHNLLNSEIDSLMIQIIEFEKVNKDLQREIENYIASDEEARSMLNRRDAMRNMLDTVTARLSQTGENIAHLRG
jgi:DNA repair exonuclease SbcCD ATPase subunit